MSIPSGNQRARPRWPARSTALGAPGSRRRSRANCGGSEGNPRQAFDIAHFAEEKDHMPTSFIEVLLTIFGKEGSVLPAKDVFCPQTRIFPKRRLKLRSKIALAVRGRLRRSTCPTTTSAKVAAFSLCARPITRAAPRGNWLDFVGFRSIMKYADLALQRLIPLGTGACRSCAICA